MAKFEHGLATYMDPGSDIPLLEVPTTQCCHCGGHFPTPGFGNDAESRKKRIGRGFCMNCNGFICGPQCAECIPQERQNDILDSGLDPSAVSVSMNGLGSKLWLPE
jgi:hypothetical protein